MIGKLFTDHPMELGMTWSGHARGAAAVGLSLVGAGLACLVHAVVPGWFTDTARRTVERLHLKLGETAAQGDRTRDDRRNFE